MYENLIADINAYIKANAANEITGPGLNNILQELLNALGTGMRFYGMANLATQPAVNQYPKFYLSFTPGNYHNFNIASQPVFTSGFAVIYDEAGNNTWAMAVKSFAYTDNTFVVDAAVRRNTFGTDTIFYVKEAEKTNNTSSFTIYAYDKVNLTEQLVATYTSHGSALTGYKTHEIDPGVSRPKFTVAVNWDVIPLGSSVQYTPEETKFPATAYVENSTDVGLDKLTHRVDLVERIGGRYNISEDGTFSRENLGADFYIGQAPSFIDPKMQTDAEDIPRLGTNIRCGYLLDSSVNLRVDLVPSNFPVQAVYYIYLVNTTATPRNITINTIDTDNESVLKYTEHTLAANSVLEIRAIKAPDMRILRYAVTEML
jgi:3D (Asp-Asp-Asp) domain-containing protein